MSALTQPYPAEADNPRWPMEPVCECGARPGAEWPMCQLACAQGRDAADVDAENCERWQAVATATGWYAPDHEGEAPDV